MIHAQGTRQRRTAVSRDGAVKGWLALVAYAYLTGLFGWKALHALFGDRWWWLFLVNSFAVYLFLPVPAVASIALLTGRRPLWLGCGAALLLWAALYGGLMVPKLSTTAVDAPTLTVMTANVLAFKAETARVIAAVRAADADVVMFQELNPPVAAALQYDLADEYPYQVLAPRPDPRGMGVISRYPLRPTGETPPGTWASAPQVLTLDIDGRPVTLVNVHAVASLVGEVDAAGLTRTILERERQARALAEFVAGRPEPLIMAGDFNTTDQSTAYATLAGVLRDAWRAAGWGLGHTFPGADSPGRSTTSLAGIRVPMWLVRIDYVFYSHHWQAASAWIGPWDTVSDHRPVVARLVLADPSSS